MPDYSVELQHDGPVAGVDEAGRAPLAGPVTAAAVILDPNNIPEGIDDSKKLSAKKREALAEQIKQSALAYSICEANLEEIEQLNILHASMLAMQRCVETLFTRSNGTEPYARQLAGEPCSPILKITREPPVHALIDGNRLPVSLPCPATPLIKGDSKSLSIAAASILAKTNRDHLMQKLAQDYPGYGWERNAGYPTKQHLNALDELGITPHHRRSFGPVRERLLRLA